jgi:hypothetical protein
LDIARKKLLLEGRTHDSIETWKWNILLQSSGTGNKQILVKGTSSQSEKSLSPLKYENAVKNEMIK